MGVAQVNKAAGSDFNPGPGAFTTPRLHLGVVERRLIQPRRPGEVVAKKNNAPGDAIASDLTRGGTPQDV